MGGVVTGVTVYGCGPHEAALIGEMAPSLGVVPTITEAAVCEANVGLAAGNRCISIGHGSRVADPTLRALAEAGVTYVSTRSSGHDHLSVTYAESLGIRVETVDYSPDGVADFAVLLVLAAVRQLKSVLGRAETHDFRLGSERGRELRDLTVGVVGTGRVGTAVIDRLHGFGCRVLAHDRNPRTAAGTGAGKAAEYVSLDELLARSDVVTLHTPLTADTHHLLDRGRLQQMRHGAFVVNTGRGALLDTDALVAALETGRLGGAALDVLEGEEGIFYADRRHEPVDNSSLLRLQALPNALVTPHTAYYTDRALRDMVRQTLTNCLRFAGERAHA